MSLYALSTKTRMVMQAKRWSQERLARECGVTARQIYILLYGPPPKRCASPRGADVIERLFSALYPDPVPAHLRRLSDRMHEIAWLKSNKVRERDRLADVIALWLDAFESLPVPADATREEKFVHSALRGHVYFAAACDVAPFEAGHEHAALFAADRKPEYVRKAIAAFRDAARFFAFSSQPRHVRERYRLLWATTMLNLGVSIYRAWDDKLDAALTLQDVKQAFAEHEVGEAAGYLYEVDPKDAIVPFNMCLWCSVLQDAEGCRQWFDRLVKVQPALREPTCKLEWMRRPMSEAPNFAFLIETVAAPVAAAVA
jgi:hypothetical protein